MIGIKKGNEYLTLNPGTQIQRERTSPIFLEQTEDGKDAIPGEISYPFTLPLSDNNLRLLGFPDNLSVSKQTEHNVILEDAGMQLSQGKLVIDTVTTHLNKANVGAIDCHLLSNLSEFWTRVKDKKLSDLSLGGERVFPWAGYSLSTAGFWKHAHDTWDYDSCDDGDYVFSPIVCAEYEKDDTSLTINRWRKNGYNVELDRENNYLSLCPHPYVAYILKQIFIEHGYTITGELLDDPDFKQICFESYRGVAWATPTYNGPLAPQLLQVTPSNPVKLRLSEHVPPVMTVGELLVELQKLFPVSFLIDDRAKTCRVVWLKDLSNAGSKDRTPDFAPQVTISFESNTAGERIIGFERPDDSVAVDVLITDYIYQGVVNSLSDLPTANASRQGQMYYVKYLNQYWVCNNYAELGGSSTLYEWQLAGDNVGSYLPEGYNTTYTSSVEVCNIKFNVMILHYFGTGNHLFGYYPYNNRRGNWFASGWYRDFEPWPPRMFFYRGRQPHYSGLNLPFATNGIYNFNSSYPMTSSHPQVGQWALSYKVASGNYGLIDKFWTKWIPTLQGKEVIKGRLYLKFHEYIQWNWNDVLLIQNTPYLIKKITEVLPYNGYIDIEAVRIK